MRLWHLNDLCLHWSTKHDWNKVGSYFAFNWHIHFFSTDMQRVLFKGTSIVQQAGLIYHVLSRRWSTRDNKCNKDANGQSVRCKTTCTHCTIRKGIQLDLCKELWPLTSFEAWGAHCWPLLFTYFHMSMANKSIPLFCIPFKNLISTVQWRWNSNDLAALKQYELDWVREKL